MCLDTSTPPSLSALFSGLQLSASESYLERKLAEQQQQQQQQQSSSSSSSSSSSRRCVARWPGAQPATLPFANPQTQELLALIEPKADEEGEG